MTMYPVSVSLLIIGMTVIVHLIFTLWLFNIAMENDPFIDGLPIKNVDFPWLC
jgi:hypothetical protein